MGAGDVVHHNHIIEGYYTALGHKLDKDIRCVETYSISTVGN